MPVLTEGRYAGEFVVSEGNGSISRTVLSGHTLEAAAVLGKVTQTASTTPSIRLRGRLGGRPRHPFTTP